MVQYDAVAVQNTLWVSVMKLIVYLQELVGLVKTLLIQDMFLWKEG